MPQQAMAASLVFLLVSCSATRHSASGPTGPRELARYALLFEQQPDGQVTHAWIPLEEFKLTGFQRPLDTTPLHPAIVRVSTSSGLDAYCDGRHDQCVKDCLRSSRPFAIGYRQYTDTRAQPWRIARSWWCPSTCMEALIECKKGRGEWAEEYAAEFDAIEPALDWIQKHRTELAVGTVVIIAGVAFAIAVAGSGEVVLVLVPVLLMAGSFPGIPPRNQRVEACK